ncbi:MAG TPA: NUDIX domain-containing protein [Acidimicrobiales bacterium]|nr:NUDIX domain-containing protein [Acidimicrobiales bacterium]
MGRQDKDRAGVVVVRQGRLALIERHRGAQHYFAVPGGGVERGESIAQAAQREAEEELGVAVKLGALRVAVNRPATFDNTSPPRAFGAPLPG